MLSRSSQSGSRRFSSSSWLLRLRTLREGSPQEGQTCGRPSEVGVARSTVSALGALALIAGSFLEWIEIGIGFDLTRTGFDLAIDVYWNWDEVNLADSFLLSAGMVTTVLGILVVAGAAASRWWL